MDISQHDSGCFTVSFPPSVPFDKVHAEAVCVLLRRDGLELASHSTDHGKLMLRLRSSTCSTVSEIHALVQKAAKEMACVLDDLLSKSRHVFNDCTPVAPPPFPIVP